MKTHVSIIGYGTMGKAIAAALKRKKGVKIFPVNRRTSQVLAAREIKKSDYIILAVKPQDAEETLVQYGSYLGKSTVLISILAGVPIKKIISLSKHKKIVRMMPNLGLSIGQGIAAWKASGLSPAETRQVKIFINNITDNFAVASEDTINKVTAISGSGPAYFFLLAESVLAASRNLGFSPAESRRLVEKTFAAAAALGKTGDYSGWIKKIASKGGTTEAALKIFKNKNFNAIVKNAVNAAYKRAKALSK